MPSQANRRSTTRAIVSVCALVLFWGVLSVAHGQAPNFSKGVSRLKRASNPKPDLNHPSNERPDSKLQQAIIRGNDARDTNDYHQALASYQEALVLNAQDERVYYGLGNLYSDLFCNDSAIEAYLKALRIKKDYLEARIGLGYTYAEEERYDHAHEQFQQALVLAPNDIEANIGQALVYAKKEKYQEAIAQIGRVIKGRSAGDQALAYIALGDVYFEQEMLQEAIAQYEKAIGLQSDLARAYSGLGMAQFLSASDLVFRANESKVRERMHTLARRATDNIKRAIELNYPKPDIYVALGFGLALQFRYDDAGKQIGVYFDKIEELKTKLTALGLGCPSGFNELRAGGNAVLAYVYVLEAIIEADNKRRPELLSEALKLSSKAVELKDNRAWVFAIQGLVYLLQGNHEKAIECFQKQLLYETKEIDKADVYSSIGVVYSLMGRRPEAIENLKEAIRRKPTAADNYVHLGNVYTFPEAGSQPDEALTNYKKALEYEPTRREAYSDIAYVYAFRKRDDDAAIEVLKKAVARVPDYAEAYLDLGRRYANKSNYDEAIKWLNKAIEVKPDFADAFYQLGRMHYFRNEYDEALRVLKKAIELKPNMQEAYVQLGRVYSWYLDGAKSDEGLTYLKRAVELDSQDPYAYFETASIYSYIKNNDDEAIAQLKKAIELKPDYARAHLELGRIFRRKNNEAAAINSFKEAIRYDSTSVQSYLGLTAIYRAQNNYDEAVKLLATAIGITPKNAELYQQLGLVYLASKDAEQAITNLNLAIQYDAKNADNYFYLARTYSELKRDDEAALKQLLKGTELNSKDPDFDLAIAEIHQRGKRYPEAIRYLESAIQKAPKVPWIYKDLAKIYEAQGKNEDAIRYYDEALKRLDPNDSTTKELYLGRQARLAGKYAEAIEHFRKVNPPDEPGRSIYEIGVVYIVSKNKKAALAQYAQLDKKSWLAEDLLRQINEMK